MNTILDYEILRSPKTNPLDSYRAEADMVQAIGRATAKGARWLKHLLVSAATYIANKWREGAEIHNRAVAAQDERHRSNYFHLRSVM